MSCAWTGCLTLSPPRPAVLTSGLLRSGLGILATSRGIKFV